MFKTKCKPVKIFGKLFHYKWILRILSYIETNQVKFHDLKK